MNYPTVRNGQIRDIHRLYDVVDADPAVPMPSVGRDGRAAFSFVKLRDATETQTGMRLTEAVLARELGLVFEDRDITVSWSASYWIRTARMDSGLFVDLVALAAHKPVEDAGATRKLVAA